MKIILSGMRPTGKLHLGNYLGALKNWVELQNSGKYQCLFMIADLHAMSEKFTANKLSRRVRNLVIDYLSCGIDPEKSTIFIQSHILEHPYLAWIFNTLMPIAELKRMHQFKEKSQEDKQINTGLFTYPILQAADILIYKADTVPVGEDQKQHVELTRDIARKFNNKFGKTFPEPQTLLTPVPRVMSLTSPTSKMSKSKGEKNYIALRDNEKTIRKKIMSAKTDVGPADKISPGVKNLFTLLKEFGTDNSYQNLMTKYQSRQLQYKKLKKTLADAIVNTLKPIQNKRAQLEKNPDQVAEILINGTKTARQVAQKTLQEVQKKCGLI